MRFAFLVGAVLVLATACGQSGPVATAGPTSAPVVTQAPASVAPASVAPATVAPATGAPAAIACAGSGGTAVSIADRAFNPAQVSTAVGATITWTNEDQLPHSVTFDDGPQCEPLRLDNGATQSMTFSAAGTYTYHCEFHPDMRGSVTVQ